MFNPTTKALMEKIDRLIQIVRTLKEEGMVSSGPTNSANASALGFNPQTESPPRRKYATLGPRSRSRWMLRRNKPSF